MLKIKSKYFSKLFILLAIFANLLNIASPLLLTVAYAQETPEETTVEEEVAADEVDAETESQDETETVEENSDEVLVEDEEVTATEELGEQEEAVEEVVVEETVEVSEQEAPVVVEEVKDEPKTQTLDENASIETLSKDGWEIDEDENVAETKDDVKLGVKYEFPLDDKVSVTFKSLPANEDKLSKLKIERVKTEDLDLPEATYTEYAYDITTDMENGTFEYDLTLPTLDQDETKVVYTEMSLEDLKKNGLDKEEVKEVDEENVEITENKIEVTELDHFTVYFVQSYSSNTYIEVKDTYSPGETVYAKATRDTAANMRLRFKNPSGDVENTCAASNSTVVYCNFNLPNNAETGVWKIEIGRCDSDCNKTGNWTYGSYAEDTFTVIPACGTKTTYEKTGDYSDSIVTIDRSNDKDSVSVSVSTGYVINKVWLDVQNDNKNGYFQYATGPLTNFNPNPGNDIDKIKVEVEKVCGETKVLICHATASDGNPFTTNDVSINSIDKCIDASGHGAHEGDIIPPFSFQTCNNTGQNWDAAGQAIWNNNCSTTFDLKVSKEIDLNRSGTYVPYDEQTHDLNFTWTYDADTTNRDMGTSVAVSVVGSHTVTENTVTGYSFTGWYPKGSTQFTCANPAGTTLPINVTQSGDPTEIVLCNVMDALPTTGKVTIIKNTVGGDGTFEFESNSNDDNSGFYGTNSITTVSNTGSKVFENVNLNTYSVTEKPQLGWTQTSLVCEDGDNTLVDTNLQTPEFDFEVLADSDIVCTFTNTKDVVTISAHKIVCTDESQLPNWGNGGNDITATTAQDWVDNHSSCKFDQGWEFQWGEETDVYPEDNQGATPDPKFHTFGPTDVNGLATVNIDASVLAANNYIWMREVWSDGYIPFTYNQSNQTNIDNVSAEIYCSVDVLNYDNLDRIDNPQVGNTYHCVAWNVAVADGSVHGYKWNDLNGNGVRDCITDDTDMVLEQRISQVCDQEPLLSGWEVFIDENDNSAWDSGEPKTMTSSDTDPSHFGWYWFENLPEGTYKICEIQQNGWQQTYPTDPVCHTVVLPDSNPSNFAVVLNYVEGPEYNFGNTQLPSTYQIHASKIVCTDERQLPNWGLGGPDITATTAQNWVNTHNTCSFASDWEFQYNNNGLSNPGDNLSTPAGAPWTSFPNLTDANGTTTVTLSEEVRYVDVREVLKDGYLGFTYNNTVPGNNQNNESAEIYCHTDVINYDNRDIVHNPEVGNDYYCVAFNVPEESLTISTTKVVCTDENDLPNWGVGGPNITATTANDWIAEHESCSLQPDWEFQYAVAGFVNPGDNSSTPAGAPWVSLPLTNDSGVSTVKVTTLGSQIEFREVLKEGYLGFTYNNYNPKSNKNDVSAEIYCANDVVNYDNFDIIRGPQFDQTYHCVAFNTPDENNQEEARLTIEKFNNVNDGAILSHQGENVKFTITVKALLGSLTDVVVTDLPPLGFDPLEDSFKVTSSVRGDLAVADPTYASPGDWNLGAMQEDEEIVIEYEARISDSQQAGLYKTLAYAYGNQGETDNSVLAEALAVGNIGDENFVGTAIRVDIESDAPEAESNVDVDEKVKVKEIGSVLGASTMPATGSNFGFSVFGVGLVLLGLLVRFRRFFKKPVQTALFTLALSVFAVTKVNASTLNARLYEPNDNVNSTFKLDFVVLSMNQSEGVVVDCYVKRPGEGSFSVFQTVHLIAGGTSSTCDVNNSVLTTSSLTPYEFYIVANQDENSATSGTVDTRYDSAGPNKPENFDVDRDNECEYDIDFRTANDGQTAKVEVYRSTNDVFPVNDSTRVKTIVIGPNTEHSFTDTVSGELCGDVNYYALRAFDSAGNASDVANQDYDETTTKTVTVTTTSSESNQGGTGGTGGVGGAILIEEGSGAVATPTDEEGTVAGLTDEEGNPIEGLGSANTDNSDDAEDDDSNPSVLGDSDKPFNWWIVLGILGAGIIGYVGYKYFAKK